MTATVPARPRAAVASRAKAVTPARGREPADEVPAPVGILSVLRIGEYRGIWFAQLASIVGDQLARLALAILIFDRSDNALLAALAFAVGYLPAIVAGPVSGLLADLVPRRKLMVGCDFSRAMLVGLMCIPAVPVPVLLALLFVVSGLDAPFSTARSAMLPEILSERVYPAAQTLGQVTDQVGQILGLGTAGALVTLLTARGTLALDAATFAVSGTLVLLTVRRRPPSGTRTSTSYWRETAQGAGAVLGAPLIRNLVGVTVVGLGLLTATEGLAVSYAHQIGGGDAAVGLLAASVPAGAVIGMIFANRLHTPRGRLEGIRLLCMFWPLPLVATVLHPPVLATSALWILAGALSSYQLLANLMFAQLIPSDMRSRAFAFARSAIIAAQGVGVLVTGAIARAIDPAWALALAGLAGVVAGPFFATSLRVGAGRHSVPDTSSLSPVRRQRSMPVSSAREVQLAPVPREAVPRARRPGVLERLKATPWRSASTYALSIGVIAAALVITVLHLIPDTTHASAVHWTWWTLAPAYLATEVFGVPFQRGRDVMLVPLSQLPLVLGMFLTAPSMILIATMTATAIFELYLLVNSRQVWVKAVVNLAGSALMPIVAEFAFQWFRQGQLVNWPTLAIAFGVATFAETLSHMFVFLARWIYTGISPLPEVVPQLKYMVPTGMAASSLGLLAVVAMRNRASYGWLLLLVGVLIIAGSRAYADLQERHRGLGQLYSFAENLGPLLPKGSDLWRVLAQTREIMTATSVELVLAPDSEGAEGAATAGMQHVFTVDVDGAMREVWRMPAPIDQSDPSDRLTVSLSSSVHRLGTLTAIDRLGHLRGFKRAELQLLQTLGGRVAEALEKGLLLGRLQEAATHDGLTGLLTLAELTSTLEQELMRGTQQLVLLVDVARLKDVNDSLGHEAGDALLRTVAVKLAELAPEGSLLARSGGGEFAAAIAGLSRDDAAHEVERLADGLSGLVQVLGVSVDLRTRSGWVHCPTDAAEAATALRRADLALGFAKRGLQRSAQYTAALEVDGMRRLRLVNDLRDAIDAREIDVVYQPIVTPQNGQVIGAEALARWTHRELGPLSPDEFIIVAEQSGLIGKLTELVLDKALCQARSWQDQGRMLRIAVNLSAKCLSDLRVPGMVLDLLARHRVSPERLTLEVTETSVAEDPTHAAVVLERLRGLGLRLSIDDFGTGYSSLAALKRFPVQEVKLDRSFMVDLEAALDRDEAAAVDVALLTAIVALGHSLGLEIVAEGIETVRAYERLRDLGVDVLQGYLIGRPGPGDTLLESFTPERRVVRRRAKV